MRNILMGLLVAAIVLGAIAWFYRIEIMLRGITMAMDRRLPVGEHQEITWQSGSDPRDPGDRPPNIVLILADDLGWNDLTITGGGVGKGTVPTPHINSIARDGVRFANGYSAHSTCAPSRAAIMSGRYGTRFGFEFTPTPGGMGAMVGRIMADMPGRIRQPVSIPVAGEPIDYDEMGMPASETTIAEVLKQRDYHTVHIGKWHLGRANGMAPHDQGFDESLLMASGLYLPEDDPGVVNAKLDFDPIDQFLWAAMKYAASYNGGPAFQPRGYLTDYYTDEAVKVIEANKDRPFFLYLAHWAPHTPLQSAKADYDALPQIESHRERVYAGMIRALDRGVGRVLDALRQNGIEDNTLVLFTSDNGGAHYIGVPDVNDPFRGWKITFFEGGIHVPYFMKWPDRLPAGRTVDAPVHGFDLYATAAAAAGAPVPDDRKIDGVNLIPYAAGERQDAPHEALFWRAGHAQVALVDGWKLQVNQRVGKTWLHDLSVDPTEEVNLADREPERMQRMLGLLAAHNAQQAKPGWPSTGELPVNVDKALHLPDSPDDVYVYTPN